MADSTIQVLSILIILLTLVIIALAPRRRYALRPIAAYDMLPTFPGTMIEASRPMHISIGSAGIGGESTLLTIASAELAYHVARRSVIGDVSPIITLSNTSALPIGQDTLRRAYQSRNLTERYHFYNVRWYPAGSRSLAFANAIVVMMSDDNVSSNVMVGSYGAELAFIMEASRQRDLPIVAFSDQLEGQAIAYALADEVLIGEELFVSEAYLGDNVSTSEQVTMDVLRWLVVLAILAGLILNMIEG